MLAVVLGCLLDVPERMKVTPRDWGETMGFLFHEMTG